VNTTASSYKILVIEAGWVICGDAAPKTDMFGAPGLLVTNAHVIRRWGTDSGLGQLAAHGTQPGTTLDPLGTAFVPACKLIVAVDSVRLVAEA